MDIDHKITQRVRNSTSPDELREWAKHSDEWIRQPVAKNIHTPPEVLVLLANDVNESRICREVARNPSTPPHTIIRLVALYPREYGWWALTNPNCPSDVIPILLKRGDVDCKARLAALCTDVESLRVLSKNKQSWQIHAGLASNPNCPSDLLVGYITNWDHRIRCGVARNPSLPTTMVESLANDPKISVRVALCYNPATPDHILYRFMKGQAVTLHRALAERRSGNVPVDMLERLARHHDRWVRAYVASNLRTPIEILQILVGDVFCEVLGGLVSNRNTTTAMLRELWGKDSSINKLILKHPNCTTDILLLPQKGG